jgi:hypothetical protein
MMNHHMGHLVSGLKKMSLSSKLFAKLKVQVVAMVPILRTKYTIIY